MASNRVKNEKKKKQQEQITRNIQEDQMRVFVRIKPDDEDPTKPKTIRIKNEHVLIFDPKQEDETPYFVHGVKQKPTILPKRFKSIRYEFHRIFGPQNTNEDVYNESIKDLLDNLLSGYNCSVFAYGATGAGKTFTMLGNEYNYGITFLTMKDLYEKVKEQQGSKQFEIYVSYLEVYNELVYDLLVYDNKPLFLRECGKTTSVAGLTIKMVNNVDELIEMLRRGNNNRTQHPTDVNAESSRSHALFQVYIHMKFKDNGQIKIAKLSMVDLAGSERATSNTGMRLREGSNINKSLLALANCINNLSDGLKHIPFRDSKLTRLLKDSLGGNCKTLMISCVSAASSSYDDTHNTLKYASRAMKIEFNINNSEENVTSVKHPPSHYIKVIADLEEENIEQKRTIEQLKKINDVTFIPKTPIHPYNLEDLKSTLESLFIKKIKINNEFLRLESARKASELNMNLEKKMIKELSLFNNQNIDEMTKELNFINTSIKQFERHVASLNDQMDILWDSVMATDNEINLFLKKLEANNIKQFLDVDIIHLRYQVFEEEKNALIAHKNEIGMVLMNHLTIKSDIIKMLAEITINIINQYQKNIILLSEEHNNIIEEMKKSHNNIVKSFMCGRKVANWNFSPESQFKIKKDDFYNLNELSIDNLRNCKKPEFPRSIKLEEVTNPLKIKHNEQIKQNSTNSEIDGMDITPESDENEVISKRALS